MKEYYRRNLPHIHPANAVFFITFRLYGSLPLCIIEKLIEEFNSDRELQNRRLSDPSIKKIPDDFYKRYFETFDTFLDTHKDDNRWLADQRVAKIVMDSIHYRDGKEYDLIAFTIMPNHVHMIVDLSDSLGVTNDQCAENITRLSVILHSLKRYSAFNCNKILNRTGAFWQSESYDRVVRNERELEYTINYILHNPVKAGLVREWKDWKFSYCKYSM